MQAQLFDTPRAFESEPPPNNSPWGRPDYTKEYAPGICLLTTPSHGGFKLSRQRNRAMPACFRLRAERGGYYEEDCAWSLVALAFPEAFKPEDYASAVSTAKHYYPD